MRHTSIFSVMQYESASIKRHAHISTVQWPASAHCQPTLPMVGIGQTAAVSLSITISYIYLNIYLTKSFTDSNVPFSVFRPNYKFSLSTRNNYFQLCDGSCRTTHELLQVVIDRQKSAQSGQSHDYHSRNISQYGFGANRSTKKSINRRDFNNKNRLSG